MKEFLGQVEIRQEL